MSAIDTAGLTGLTSEEVAQQIAAGQVNDLPTRSSRSVGQILRGNILTRFNALLLSLAAVVIVVDQHFINALFGLVMVVNSGIGIFQELRAKRKLDHLAILNAPKARVLRDGQIQDIAVEQVVLGETLLLTLGDQVAADGQVATSQNLEVDESALTGESDPIVKEVGDQVLSGSMVVAGSGAIAVTVVGAESYSAKITAHVKRFQRADSEIMRSTNLLLKWISWMLLVVGPILVFGQLRLDLEEWRTAVVHATAALVGMIPEGLVLLTSMAFMLAAMTLTRRQVLVQQLPAVEGLARVDTLLLDKTGTLTEGHIEFNSLAECPEPDQPMVQAVLATFAARASNPTNEAIGQAMEGIPPLATASEVPFSSRRKWSGLVCDAGAPVDEPSWLLGAPEVLFAGLGDNPVFRSAQAVAAQGQRVLVLMSAPAMLEGQQLPASRHPRALVILSEAIRPDARQTLEFFAEQGVAIKVISGDSPLTVAAVARQVGIANEGAFDARDLPEAPEDMAPILASHSVFGRVQPEQKRAIAKCLQGQGRVVAMTGDGVNDALALKDADIGIAMNSGAAATKGVAELVLLDDRFAHLPKVLAEGRRVIANVERVANLFVIKNVYSLVLALCVTVAGLTYPYLPSQMTVISALTIGVPAFFLALGPNHRIYRPGFLKRVLGFAIPVGVVAAAAMMVNYAIVMHWGVTQAEAGSATSVVVVMIGYWVLFCLARPLRTWKVALIVAVAAAYVGVLAIPWFAQLFNYTICWATMPVALTGGAVGAALVELIWRKSHRRLA